jgi:tRNA pseudouridine55 synthase
MTSSAATGSSTAEEGEAVARRPPAVHGVTIVDKPAGITSHDVVGQLRRRFQERRIGHAGTLDPGATGVLVVGVGTVTRLLRFVTEGRKRYTGEIVIGVETDTLDADGVVTAVHPLRHVDVEAARSAIARHLLGDIQQVPPMVSALKVGGRRLHDAARQGIEIERAPRPVRVDRFDIVGQSVDAEDHQLLRVEVDCGPGTYVRSLAADLGRLLDSGAHLRNLRRTAVEPFTIDEAAAPDECTLLPPLEAVRALAKVTVDEAGRQAIAVGRTLPLPGGSGPWAMVAAGGDLLAVYEPSDDGRAKAAVVLGPNR